eukprot:9263547-Lingulodinium_polyedra.AAC.1
MYRPSVHLATRLRNPVSERDFAATCCTSTASRLASSTPRLGRPVVDAEDSAVLARWMAPR